MRALILAAASVLAVPAAYALARLRFRGNPHVEFYHYVIRAIERALHAHIQAGEVHKIQTDTYQRELERYGMHRIDLCEALFHQDSLSTLQFLAQTGENYSVLAVSVKPAKHSTLITLNPGLWSRGHFLCGP